MHSPKKRVYLCNHCGKEFLGWKYRNSKYCSRRCASKEHGKSIAGRKMSQQTCIKISIAKKKYYEDPANIEKMKLKLIGKTKSDEEKKRTSDAIRKYWKEHPNEHPMIGTHLSEETKQKIRKTKRQRFELNQISPEEKIARKRRRYDSKNKKRNAEYKPVPKEIKLQHQRESKIGDKNPAFGKVLSQHTIEKRTWSYIETLVGGFWYGNVKYPERVIKEYCELWTPNLCERIRAAWNYKSAISGKTLKDNNNHALSCHHVYYQTKACCKYDEDIQGYYAWIDIGTKNKPELYKHYIVGSPNKFVPLTRSEHSRTNHNRLFWILYFEDIISRKNGKCYLSKPEFNMIRDSNDNNNNKNEVVTAGN